MEMKMKMKMEMMPPTMMERLKADKNQVRVSQWTTTTSKQKPVVALQLQLQLHTRRPWATARPARAAPTTTGCLALALDDDHDPFMFSAETPLGVHPFLDLYFRAIPTKYKDTPRHDEEHLKQLEILQAREEVEYMNQLLSRAWSRDPLTTLKLIETLRARFLFDYSHNKLLYYRAVTWLHYNHPRTLLACNAGGKLCELADILYHLRRAKGCEKDREMYKRDVEYRLLHDRFSDIFADKLRSDIQNLDLYKEKKKPSINDFNAAYHKISLAAYNYNILEKKKKATLFCENIAKKVFPLESYPEYKGLTKAQYARTVRDRLMKEVVMPLEDFWHSRVYDDPGRFWKVKYPKKVKVNSNQLDPGFLLPHEIIQYVNHEDVGDVAELQWKRMVEEFYLNKAKFNDCLVVCNVSPDIRQVSNPICVSVALLVSQLSSEPWKGKVINFSRNPELHNLNGHDDLKSKCSFFTRMECERVLDWHKVFDLILQVAVNENLRPDEMIKKVFVLTYGGSNFSNFYGQFRDSRVTLECEYAAIQNKFVEKGYGDAVPQIVFWNLSGQELVPYRQPGVAYLGGFSESLFKLFLDNNGEVGPHHIMEEDISWRKYQNLIVVD